MNEIDMMKVIKTMSCKAMQQALMYCVLGIKPETAIESAIEGEIELTITKWKQAGVNL